MKSLAFSLSISIFLFSSLINVVFAQSFSDICNSITLTGSLLGFTCPTADGGEHTGQVNLNLCITNNDGELEAAPELAYPNTRLNRSTTFTKDIPICSGGYSPTCLDCTLQTGNEQPLNLRCSCYPLSGVLFNTEIDLGQFSTSLAA